MSLHLPGPMPDEMHRLWCLGDTSQQHPHVTDTAACTSLTRHEQRLNLQPFLSAGSIARSHNQFVMSCICTSLSDGSNSDAVCLLSQSSSSSLVCFLGGSLHLCQRPTTASVLLTACLPITLPLTAMHRYYMSYF